jgi:hypothetical protein
MNCPPACKRFIWELEISNLGRKLVTHYQLQSAKVHRLVPLYSHFQLPIIGAMKIWFSIDGDQIRPQQPQTVCSAEPEDGLPRYSLTEPPAIHGLAGVAGLSPTFFRKAKSAKVPRRRMVFLPGSGLKVETIENKAFNLFLPGATA